MCASISRGTSTIHFSIPLAVFRETAESKCVKCGLCLIVSLLWLLGTDYGDLEPNELILGLGENTSCTNITIAEDNIYEENETLLVIMSPLRDLILDESGPASILIVDNDRKLVC